MHVHILGICGTFMGGLALLARQLGYEVTGSDQNVYPPMSTQLEESGVKIYSGYDNLLPLTLKPDFLVVGNVMCRGMPIIEAALNQNIPLFSGPEWLARHILKNKQVLAVSGTHGKTTTSSMLAWILEYANLGPGFLIGGIPYNFGVSARLGESPYFVVEADEYDSAFFDKRSKFVHYRPKILIINNLEFDHADIFSDLAAIQTQFHHLVRTVPGEGLIIVPLHDQNVSEVLKKGCWSPIQTFSTHSNQEWFAKTVSADGSQFEVYYQGKKCGEIMWSLLGEHNVQNALAALAAAKTCGVQPQNAIEALKQFKNVKRRLEIKEHSEVLTVYDDFAHHPTAIATTLAGLRAKAGSKARIVAVIDIRSNTMKAGHHQTTLPASVREADAVYFFKSADFNWDVEKMWEDTQKPGGVYSDREALLKVLLEHNAPRDQLIFMSNGGFSGIQTEFVCRVQSRET